MGDAVGDPSKDTTSVARNSIIKFTTLFGLLAVELAIQLDWSTATVLSAGFFAVMLPLSRREPLGALNDETSRSPPEWFRI